MPTLVKFLKSKDSKINGDITAVFPQLKFNKELYGNDMLTGYAHIGQHTSVSKEWIKNNAEPATEIEYADLKKELESIGYVLKVCNSPKPTDMKLSEKQIDVLKQCYIKAITEIIEGTFDKDGEPNVIGMGEMGELSDMADQFIDDLENNLVNS